MNFAGACGNCGHRKRKHQSKNLSTFLSSSCHVHVFRDGLFGRCGCEIYRINNLLYLEQMDNLNEKSRQW